MSDTVLTVNHKLEMSCVENITVHHENKVICKLIYQLFVPITSVLLS